jgi:hypothetical protein
MESYLLPNKEEVVVEKEVIEGELFGGVNSVRGVKERVMVGDFDQSSLYMYVYIKIAC